QESGGNPKPIKYWDSNAAAASPSKELMHTIDPTFQSYKDPGYDNIWDPEANIRASMNYALGRYGSLPAAYDRAGGYALGGVIPKIPTGFGLYRDNGGNIPPGKSLVTNETGRPEAVLNWEQLERISCMLSSLSSMEDFQYVADVVGRMGTTGIYEPGGTRFGSTGEDDALGQALWATRAQWFATAAEIEEIFSAAG